MLTFLSTYWIWFLLIGAMLLIHSGHGGHGGRQPWRLRWRTCWQQVARNERRHRT